MRIVESAGGAGQRSASAMPVVVGGSASLRRITDMASASPRVAPKF